jgi:hypothetical protein
VVRTVAVLKSALRSSAAFIRTDCLVIVCTHPRGWF